MAYSVFGDSIDYDTIRINGDNTIICKRLHIAFVSFHTIHYHQSISDSILIHELVHVWQYERFGSAYIARALLAQHSKMGYKYGGLAALSRSQKLTDFNFEQMAEIIKHGFEYKGQHEIYNNFMGQLQESV